MKKVLLLIGHRKWTSEPFADICNGYTLCYQHLYTLGEENGVKFYRASRSWYNAEKKRFDYAWTFENGAWTRVENIVPDLIFDKTSTKPKTHFIKTEIVKEFLIVNDLSFSTLIDNKLYTSLLFPKYTKKHYKADSQKELNACLTKIATEKVVLKTASGSGGKNVFIADKSDVNHLELPFPILAQEFIDSSSGIAGITDTVHDLRLVFIDNTLFYAYVRTPKSGSLLANLSQGGTMKIVPEERLPKSVDTIVEDVKRVTKPFAHTIYTIDIMFDENQKPWIVELNSMPGLFFAEDQHRERDKTYRGLINLFKNAIDTHTT